MKSKAKIQKAPVGKRIIKFWPLYVMLIPCVVYYILICYVPIAGNVLAFKDYSFKKGIWGSDWVALRYFKTFFTGYDCLRLIKNTLTVGLIKCILEFPFAIILALMLNEVRNMKFKKISQTITYLPHFLSSVIVTMTQRILAPNNGVLNQIIAAFGGKGDTFFLMESNYFYPILFVMDIWRNIGWDSIVYLAAFASWVSAACFLPDLSRFTCCVHRATCSWRIHWMYMWFESVCWADSLDMPRLSA